MKFYRINDVPAGQSEIVFRESALRKGLGVVLICGLAAIPLGIAWRQGGALPLYVMGAGCGLFALIFLWIFIKTLRSSNWLVRCNASGLLIKFRSYLNNRLSDDDVVVVGLEFREIAWARKAVEKSATSSLSGETRTERRVYLDIKAPRADLSELKKRIREEQERPAPAGKIKALGSPVRVVEGDVIRIEWRSGSSRVTPSVDRLLAMLPPSVAIHTEQRDDRDVTSLDGDDIERESRIGELVENGQEIEAVSLARDLYGLSLTEAKQLVDGLQDRLKE